ncbi:hypothetical protein HS041_18635 [Planomonospora sp. ID67723]|uniref:hypothetical protein n=1 Tax=Planomonospora sp. ID67723 TaxID=2738134 RepID=UPI0018C3F46F|nr:hypothetical protein [Planomonospora sp. ID67723]MBG0829785.1 hypothetical protein [Planomonospora sp. ID67723]
MRERSPDFRYLLSHFSDDGFEFVFSRAKVFLYAPAMENDDDVIAPNLLGILPSFRPVRRDDPFHIAVGIAVHNSNGVVATEVRVEHNPFYVSQWTLHELRDGKIISSAITNDELSEQSADEIASRFGRFKVDLGETRFRNAPPDSRQIEQMLTVAFDQIINDSYARPIYPSEGIASLMSQTPQMVKFSTIQRLRYSNSPRWLVATSSTCCNGCTTTSVAYHSDPPVTVAPAHP